MSTDRDCSSKRSISNSTLARSAAPILVQRTSIDLLDCRECSTSTRVVYNWVYICAMAVWSASILAAIVVLSSSQADSHRVCLARTAADNSVSVAIVGAATGPDGDDTTTMAVEIPALARDIGIGVEGVDTAFACNAVRMSVRDAAAISALDHSRCCAAADSSCLSSLSDILC